MRYINKAWQQTEKRESSFLRVVRDGWGGCWSMDLSQMTHSMIHRPRSATCLLPSTSLAISSERATYCARSQARMESRAKGMRKELERGPDIRIDFLSRRVEMMEGMEKMMSLLTEHCACTQVASQKEWTGETGKISLVLEKRWVQRGRGRANTYHKIKQLGAIGLDFWAPAKPANRTTMMNMYSKAFEASGQKSHIRTWWFKY